MKMSLLVLCFGLSVLTGSTLTNGQAIDNGNNRTFVVNFCSENSGDALGFVTLDTIRPSSWPRDSFCQALAGGAAIKGNYNMTLQLFNDLGFGTRFFNSGNPGIAFNVKDSMNYDFVFFRLNAPDKCFQTGYILDSELNVTQEAKCPNGPPKTRKWFTVQVEVTNRKTRLFVDGGHVVTFSHHHENFARGGAVVANGYRNRVFFRHYKTEPIVKKVTEGTKVTGCVAHCQTPAYNTLDATSGTWPASGFCRVLINPGVSGTEYRLSVDLYNEKGWQGINSGHPGVMYNVQDIDNFDFVYFRPHSASGCFQTGYVRDGQLKWDGAVSSRCTKSVPGGRWFNVEVRVGGASATIYKDGALVHTARPKLQPRANGGVIVANGYKNVVRYKNFKINQF